MLIYQRVNLAIELAKLFGCETLIFSLIVILGLVFFQQ